jgi:hypothetical protein
LPLRGVTCDRIAICSKVLVQWTPISFPGMDLRCGSTVTSVCDFGALMVRDVLCLIGVGVVMCGPRSCLFWTLIEPISIVWILGQSCTLLRSQCPVRFGFGCATSLVFDGGMLGLLRKEKIKINSDVSRAKMPDFIEQFKPHAFVD